MMSCSSFFLRLRSLSRISIAIPSPAVDAPICNKFNVVESISGNLAFNIECRSAPSLRCTRILLDSPARCLFDCCDEITSASESEIFCSKSTFNSESKAQNAFGLLVVSRDIRVGFTPFLRSSALACFWEGAVIDPPTTPDRFSPVYRNVFI